MPTQDQVRQNVEEFEREYPESLPDRLMWWARVLGIDRVRLLRLVGLTRAEADRSPQSDLHRVVASHEDQAESVNEMLGQLLASFDYDVAALRKFVHNPVGPESVEKRRVTRRPGVVVPPPYPLSPKARSGILLNEIVAGGPSALPALLAYLREAGTGNGRSGNQGD